MSAAFKVACVQNCAVAEVERNIDIAARPDAGRDRARRARSSACRNISPAWR